MPDTVYMIGKLRVKIYLFAHCKWLQVLLTHTIGSLCILLNDFQNSYLTFIILSIINHVFV